MLAVGGLEIPAVGAFCLGLFIGYLAWYFVVRLGLPGVSSVKPTFSFLASVPPGPVW
jgi:hypothetical protein